MAQFDLKFATIRIKDGYTLVGAVNLMAGYAIGLSTIAVDGFTGAVETGIYFTITGDVTRYRVTAHTETLGNTVSVTFTPPLVAMAADNTVVTFGPHQLEVKVGDGNLSYSEKRPITYVKDRGNLDTVRLGDQDPVEVKLDFQWVFLKADVGDPPSVEDALKRRGNATAWVSSATDQCEPFAVDIEVEYIPQCANVKREIITLADFRYEELGHEMKQGMVSLNGKCNITEAAIVRAA